MDGIHNIGSATRPAIPSPLEKAARETEGVFIGMLLKECFAPMLESQEGGAHAGPLLEQALEQTARSIADAHGIGIADSLCRQLTLEK
jgi:Rod binding domain-containing protein